MKPNINALPQLPNCHLLLLTIVYHFYCDCYSLWKNKIIYIYNGKLFAYIMLATHCTVHKLILTSGYEFCEDNLKCTHFFC
jgi:hypothetical protein